MDTPCNLTAAKPRDSWGKSYVLRSQLPLLGLIGANENIRLIISRMRKSRGESQGLVLTRQKGLNDYWEIK